MLVLSITCQAAAWSATSKPIMAPNAPPCTFLSAVCWRLAMSWDGWSGNPEKCTLLTFGWLCKNLAIWLAFSQWAFIRSDKVSRPFSNTHALKGDRLIPPVRTTPKAFSIKSLLPTNAPPSTRPWPSIYLLAECNTTSAPNIKGFWMAGVAKQLSTINSASWSCASLDKKLKSAICAKGLEGLSQYSTLVFGCIACCQASLSKQST